MSESYSTYQNKVYSAVQELEEDLQSEIEDHLSSFFVVNSVKVEIDECFDCVNEESVITIEAELDDYTVSGEGAVGQDIESMCEEIKADYLLNFLESDSEEE